MLKLFLISLSHLPSYVNKSHQTFGIERTKLLLYIFNFDDFANFSLAKLVSPLYIYPHMKYQMKRQTKRSKMQSWVVFKLVPFYDMCNGVMKIRSGTRVGKYVSRG